MRLTKERGRSSWMGWLLGTFVVERSQRLLLMSMACHYTLFMSIGSDIMKKGHWHWREFQEDRRKLHVLLEKTPKLSETPRSQSADNKETIGLQAQAAKKPFLRRENSLEAPQMGDQSFGLDWTMANGFMVWKIQICHSLSCSQKGLGDRKAKEITPKTLWRLTVKHDKKVIVWVALLYLW